MTKEEFELYKTVLARQRGGQHYETLGEIARELRQTVVRIHRMISGDEGLIERGYLTGEFSESGSRRRLMTTTVRAISPEEALALVEDESLVAEMRALINGQENADQV